ncbi:peptidoglycan-binding domain-containing protein [Kitasatospora sp. NPDC050463]|uniref:peptidoglycan-binding domain-containing protein n=1 Tax=Kitasatospora sp. NPDC050463 TaxID=3155786 RepID=UPI003408FA1C
MSITRKLSTAAAALGLAAAAVIGTSTAADASTSAPYIGRGYSEYGSGVWCVQHMLNHNISAYGGVSEDSVWGPKTEAAVKDFQRSLAVNEPGLKVDGIVGPRTGWWLLYFNNDGYGYSHTGGGDGYCVSYVPSSF